MINSPTMNKSSGSLKCVFAVSKMVTKLSKIREKSNKKKIADLLENSAYLQKIIHDPQEQQEFLDHATKYMKYKFYPKGTLIHGFHETMTSFSIIAKGKAYLYTPKRTEQAKKEYHNFQKSQVIKEYIQYICNEKLEEKLKQWLCKKEFGTRALRKRHDLVTSGSTNIDTTPRMSTATTDMSSLDEYNALVEKILKEKSDILPVHLHDYDLTKTEKLLLLSHFGLPGENMKDGVFTIQMTKELKNSDVFGEIGLLKPVSVDYAVIAVEDVHLVSFTRDDYRELFADEEIKNFREKLEFLGRAFSETSTQSLMKIAYFLEEKVLNGREVLYKEGEDPKAIYFIKKGEVQLLLQEKKANTTTSVSEIKSKSVERHNNKHNKLVIGNLQAGSMFGEEEVIQKTKRGYTAVSCSPQTVLYVLRNDIFTEMFDKHLPHIAAIFKDWMKVKSQWRKQRIGAEKEIKTYFESTTTNDKKPSSITSENNPKKFYVLQKEQEVDPSSGLVGIEDRTTLKRIAKRDAILNTFTPTKPNPQSSNEYQIFSRQIFEDLSPVKKGRSKNKIVSLADTQSTKIGTLNSLVPSINDLMSPSSKVFDSKNNIDKSKTLNNELVSGGNHASMTFSKKAQTVLTLENEVLDNLEYQPTFSVIRNIKPPSFNDFIDASPKIAPATVTSNYLPKVGMSDLLKTPERVKLSKGGMKILNRITSQSQVEEFEPQRGSTDYGFKTPERQRKMMKVPSRTLTKLTSLSEVDNKVNDRSGESGKLKKGPHGILIKNAHVMSHGGQITSPRNRRLERSSTNTLSIKNLELKF